MGHLQVFLSGGEPTLSGSSSCAVAVLVWGLGTFVFLYFWPPITYSAYKRAVVRHGLGGDPQSPSIRCTRCPLSLRPRHLELQLISNRDQRRALHRRPSRPLQRAARVAHAGHGGPVLQRAVHADPSDGTNFAYVGTRATGTGAGDYLRSAGRAGKEACSRA